MTLRSARKKAISLFYRPTGTAPRVRDCGSLTVACFPANPFTFTPARLTLNEPISCVQYSNDARMLACGTADGNVLVCSPAIQSRWVFPDSLLDLT